MAATERLNATRRTILSAALAIPATAAITILPADAHAAVDETNDTAPLADFAIAWLACWTEQGGSVTVGQDGRCWIGTPCYQFSRAYIEVPVDFPKSVRASQEAFRDAHYHGQMRGLENFLDAMPGGRDAVRAVIRACPVLGLKPATEV